MTHEKSNSTPSNITDYLGVYLLGRYIRYDWHAHGSFRYYYIVPGTLTRKYFTSITKACEDIIYNMEDVNGNLVLAKTYLIHSFSHYALSQLGNREQITILYKKLIKCIEEVEPSER